MYKQITIKTLFEQGKKQAAIARDIACHRNTVRNIVKRDEVIDKQTRERESQYSPYKEHIETWYKKDKLNYLQIHEKLQEEYQVKGSYDALRRFVQKYFPKEIEAYGVQEHKPGSDMEVDFGEIIVFFEEEKRRIKLQILAFVLPYSGMKYYEVCENQKLETFIDGYTKAFTYFGGVPKRVKVDNLKSAVIKNQRYSLEFNQTFLEYSYHYGFAIIACTPYSPEQKGTVEGGVKYIQQNFVPGKTFKNREDLQKQLRIWIESANNKMHATTKKIISQSFFSEEKEKLQMLKTEDYSFFNRCERVVGLNCHIHFENNYYSVPFSYVQKTVTVRFNKSVVRVIYQAEEIALHKRCTGQGNFVTQRVHLPADKVYSETEYQLRHEKKMKEIGTNAHEYFTMLLQEQPRYWGQTIRPIYGFVKEYGNVAVDKALKRALSYKVSNIRVIKNILEGKLYDMVDSITLPTFEEIGNSRELSYYSQEKFI